MARFYRHGNGNKIPNARLKQCPTKGLASEGGSQVTPGALYRSAQRSPPDLNKAPRSQKQTALTRGQPAADGVGRPAPTCTTQRTPPRIFQSDAASWWAKRGNPSAYSARGAYASEVEPARQDISRNGAAAAGNSDEHAAHDVKALKADAEARGIASSICQSNPTLLTCSSWCRGT